MAGFPVRSLDQWQRELVEAGLQLAICNQQPSRKDQSSPSLLEREVVRLITPGTLTEPLDHSSNFLLSISPGPLSALGLAWADVSTSEFVVGLCLFVLFLPRQTVFGEHNIARIESHIFLCIV
jgi:DNA mismatch repair protein MutS